MKKAIVLTVFGLMFSASLVAQTAVCPDSPNKVMVTVTPSVTFDAATNLYTYKYSVVNAASSAQEIERFTIDVDTPFSGVKSPQFWGHHGFSYRNALAWFAGKAAPRPAGMPAGGVPPGLGDIKPGANLDGFSLQSSKGPGPVKFFVHGYVGIATGIADPDVADPEEVAYSCPNAGGDLFETAVVGTTLGPVNFVPVNIAIKPVATAPVPINPRENGVTAVAILGTSNFDASKVDVASLKFGTGEATAHNDKGHLDDVNRDGFKDMIVQFPSQQIGARCNDTALFLTGKLLDGTALQGSEAIVTVGCK